MIRVLSHKEIDPGLWDSCIYNSIHGNVFGLYHSISVACNEWLGFVYGEYEAVLALPIKKKLRLSYSWHPQFMGPLGVFSPEPSEKITQEFYKTLLKHSWWIKMHYWEQVEVKGARWEEKKFQELYLGKQDVLTIKKNYKDNTQRSIKKAVKNNLSAIVLSLNGAEVVTKMFRDEKGSSISNLDENSFRLLNKLMGHFEKHGLGHTTVVLDQEENMLASGFFLAWKDTVIYYKGSVTPEGKQKGAMHFLIDEEIKTAAGKFTRFDFGGSNVETVARFYKNFGGEDRSYYLLQYKKIGR